MYCTEDAATVVSIPSLRVNSAVGGSLLPRYGPNAAMGVAAHQG